MDGGSVPNPVAMLVLVVAVLIACGGGQPGQQGHLRLEVMVETPEGDPIEGAEIFARRAEGGPSNAVATATTDKDGRSVLEVPFKTALQLSVIAEDRLLPDVPLLVDGAIPRAQVTVVLPRADSDNGERWLIRWTEPLGYLEECEQIQDTAGRALAEWQQEIRSRADPETGHAAIPDDKMVILKEARVRLDEWMASAQDSRVRAFSAVQLLRMEVRSGWFRRISPELADRIRTETPLASPFWGFFPNGIGIVLERMDPGLTDREGFRSTIESCLAENPDRQVQAEALAGLVSLASSDGDNVRAGELYGRLETEYGEVYDTTALRMFFDPEGHVSVGQPVPHFAVTLLDGRGLTNADFEGRYLLIHFWGTWCGPCKAEMPQLDEAHRRFGQQGLQILSVAINDTKEMVETFRGGKWSMPWQHAVPQGGFESGVARQFNLSAVPHTVLVDPEGVIAASPTKTRGDALLETLEEHLGAEGG